MNIKQLEYFIEVAKYKGFTNAAKKNYVSQSTLSKSIKVLEEDLDTTLIDRNSSTFKLTMEGSVLYENGIIALSKVKGLLENLKDSIAYGKGEITIGVPPVISTVYFTTIANKFLKTFKTINLKVIEKGANSVKSLVETGESDIGAVMLPFQSNNFDTTPVFSSDCVLVVNKKHPLAKYDDIDLNMIKGEPMIILGDSYMLHDKIYELCDSVGVIPEVISTSTQWDFITEMVALNQCITILPRLIVQRYKSKKIKLLTIKNPVFPWNIGLITRKDKYICKNLQLFINFCKNEGKNYCKYLGTIEEQDN